ncbi:uncharacterized protein LOC133986415 [Scomber scombrus]|uniref:uncharacterized protein LOC133986415 n=1 Tax=Scomber scombrus TaxID=13677 RepID=UPI002DD8F2C7|nr:uncharacterized protein LOC133986415 [Scomber scombrus]
MKAGSGGMKDGKAARRQRINAVIKAVGCTDDQIFETKTVRVGDNVKLTCIRQLTGTMYWIKLVPENVPQILARTFGYEDGPGPSTDITTVPPSDPVRPGDPVTLQCSVLSANKTCLEEHNVYWFSATLDKSHPSFIYTHGNSTDRSEKSLDTQSLQKCIYNISSNNISSSDAGTYYCAVTTCGEILRRNRTKLDNDAVSMCDVQKAYTVLSLLSAALALSLSVIIGLVYSIKKMKKKSCDGCNVTVDLHMDTAASGVQQSRQIDDDSLVYSVATFTSKKSYKSGTRDKKTAEEETIYTDVSTLVLN